MKREIKITLIVLGIGLLIVGIVGGVIVGLNRKKGNVSKVIIIEVSSKIYSKDEINNAIEVTEDYFKSNFNACTLREIKYIGDDKNADFQDFASRNNKAEVIALISIFETGYDSNGTLNTNSTYVDFKWILVRNKNEKWQLVDLGY